MIKLCVEHLKQKLTTLVFHVSKQFDVIFDSLEGIKQFSILENRRKKFFTIHNVH